MNIYKCELFLLKVQFGALGSHSDVSVHVRCAEPDILNPRSHVYVAVANRVLLPCIPGVKFNIPFSGGKRFPQSNGKRQNMCSFFFKYYNMVSQNFTNTLPEQKKKDTVDKSH